MTICKEILYVKCEGGRQILHGQGGVGVVGTMIIEKVKTEIVPYTIIGRQIKLLSLSLLSNLQLAGQSLDTVIRFSLPYLGPVTVINLRSRTVTTINSPQYV